MPRRCQGRAGASPHDEHSTWAPSPAIRRPCARDDLSRAIAPTLTSPARRPREHSRGSRIPSGVEFALQRPIVRGTEALA